MCATPEMEARAYWKLSGDVAQFIDKQPKLWAWQRVNGGNAFELLDEIEVLKTYSLVPSIRAKAQELHSRLSAWLAPLGSLSPA